MVVRIAGVTIPADKRVEVSLTYIYGIGRSTSLVILEGLKISPDKRVKDLSEEEVNKLRGAVEKGRKVEGDLRREIAGNVKRLKEISCYRGSRHSKGLPVRGQRTKTNSRTVRGGKRVTAVSGKKPVAKK